MSQSHVRAWGHSELPDIDTIVDSDDLPPRLNEYPWQSVALLTPITYAMIAAALERSPS